MLCIFKIFTMFYRRKKTIVKLINLKDSFLTWYILKVKVKYIHSFCMCLSTCYVASTGQDPGGPVYTEALRQEETAWSRNWEKTVVARSPEWGVGEGRLKWTGKIGQVLIIWGIFRSLAFILWVIYLSIQAQKFLRPHFPVYFIYFTQVYFSSCLLNNCLLVTSLLSDTWS